MNNCRQLSFGILLMLSLFGLTACDSNPPELTKAQRQFESSEQRDLHIVEMRSNHMHLLMHKRDRTVHEGVRTPKYSLNGCIDCHVPAPTATKVVKHADPEHFCATCHIDVAVKLDCFQCHADRPTMKVAEEAKP